MDRLNTDRYNSMISSQTVNGTDVYSPSGDRIGQIEELLIDKQSGRVAYAMMGFGGFLGLGEDYYPLPWGKLSYDTRLEGYVTDVTRQQLEAAPARNDDWYSDRDWERGYYGYYGLPPYWL